MSVAARNRLPSRKQVLRRKVKRVTEQVAGMIIFQRAGGKVSLREAWKMV